MLKMLQFIWDNKEIFFSGLGATVIGGIITAVLKKKKKNKKKTIVKKYITNNTINNTTTTNTTTNTTNSHNKYNSHNTNSKTYNAGKTNLQQSHKSFLELTSIRLYSTGVKGKVYTSVFHKAINHNFGIELIIKNNTNQSQKVKIGWCIYNDKGKTLMNGTFYEKIVANTSFKKDFYVSESDFKKLSVGKYKSQFWLNDKKVRKEFFTVKYQ